MEIQKQQNSKKDFQKQLASSSIFLEVYSKANGICFWRAISEWLFLEEVFQSSSHNECGHLYSLLCYGQLHSIQKEVEIHDTRSLSFNRSMKRRRQSSRSIYQRSCPFIGLKASMQDKSMNFDIIPLTVQYKEMKLMFDCIENTSWSLNGKYQYFMFKMFYIKSSSLQISLCLSLLGFHAFRDFHQLFNSILRSISLRFHAFKHPSWGFGAAQCEAFQCPCFLQFEVGYSFLLLQISLCWMKLEEQQSIV